MIIKQDIVVLSATRYSFENERGQTLEGTSVWYYDETPINEDNRIGLIPVKATLPVLQFDAFKGQTFPIAVTANVRVDLARGKMKVESFEPRKK